MLPIKRALASVERTHRLVPAPTFAITATLRPWMETAAEV